MTQRRYSQLVQQTMGGQNLLPESNVISDAIEELYGNIDTTLGGILGKDWRDDAQKSFPREFNGTNSVVPNDRLPDNDNDIDNSEATSTSDSNNNNQCNPGCLVIGIGGAN